MLAVLFGLKNMPTPKPVRNKMPPGVSARVCIQYSGVNEGNVYVCIRGCEGWIRE